MTSSIPKMQPANLTDLQVPILDCAFCEKYINQLGIGKLVCKAKANLIRA